MREIKFRGYNRKNKQWLYGFYLQNRGAHFVAPDEFATGKSWEDYEIDPATLGQFTGFTDSKETDIYDGDIIQVKGGPYHQIKWLNEIGGFGICNLVSMRELTKWPDRCLFSIPAQDWWQDFGREIIVAGNIHDNPDYLERFVEQRKKKEDLLRVPGINKNIELV